ncbi:hypothetical protein VNO80_27879 [Phaseolus coccineus]|uniref:Gfo/Idh/MocA-like oxidoreductase C-terminal domain-containing protein n=1 Tax=Phaseolus coccineus TaxID=3886 RepID=A0AAN9LGY6_PHACN
MAMIPYQLSRLPYHDSLKVPEADIQHANAFCSFFSFWQGGFLLDMGVHFVAALRMVLGGFSFSNDISCRFDLTSPRSRIICLECLQWLSPPPEHARHVALRRVVGLNGTLEVEHSSGGEHGYLVSFYGGDGQNKSSFFPITGVTEELKAFINDVSENTLKKGSQFVAEPRLSFEVGARDVAVLEAMFESGAKQGELVQVKNF